MSKFFTLKNNLVALYGTIMIGRRPKEVKYVIGLGDAQDNLAEASRLRREMTDPFRHSGLEAMWQERYHPAMYKVQELLSLPEDTLGGRYARHMVRNDIKPDFYRDVTARHRMHFLRLRIRQTHDIWHVLAGFDMDRFGEVGLQGFNFGQFTNGQSVLVLVGAIMRSLFLGDFGELEFFIEAFCEGYKNGSAAGNLLDAKWEDLWHEKVADLQRRYAIAPARCRRGVMPDRSEAAGMPAQTMPAPG